MKKFLLSCFLFFVFCFLFFACGGSSEPTIPVGPDLDISELSSIRIDQLKFSGGTDDDNDTIPEASVYLRCKESGLYLVCSGQDQGLDVVKKSGLAYGRLNGVFEPVEGASGSCLDVEVVFVEKDSSDCPKPISPDDDIVGTSSPLSINEAGTGSLLGKTIASSDAASWIIMIAEGGEHISDIEPSPAITDSVLTLDQVYFTEPEIEGGTADFKLTVHNSDDLSEFHCEASFDETSGIIKEDLFYSGLGIQLVDATGAPCSVTAENKITKVRISLTILTGGGESQTITTDPENEITLLDTVDGDGGREKFADEKGFVRFTHIEGM